MKTDKNFEIVYKLLETNGIFELLRLESRYKSGFVDMICFDYNTLNNQFIHHSPLNGMPNVYFKLLSTLFAALLSTIRTSIFWKRNIDDLDNADIILLPFADKIIRFEYICSIINKPISIIYHPLWHFNNIKKHMDWYKRRGEQVSLESFGIKNIVKTSFNVLTNVGRIKKCSKELDVLYNSNINNFAFRLTMALLYDGFIRNLVYHINNRQSNKIWLFDYDLDYKYIIFNNVIKSVRRNDKTVHIQHGAFVKEVESYCNPLSDYSLCCSEREKKIIMRNNRYKSKIMVLGAPFQTFQSEIEDNHIDLPEQLYDITLLLTNTGTDTLQLQQNVLGILKKSNYRLLLRFRPASKDIDIERIGDVTDGMTISQGTTLLRDIKSAKLIICFSEDALYECIRNNKPTIFCLPDSYDYLNIYDFGQPSSEAFVICNSEEFKNIDISKMKNLTNIHFENDMFIINNYGVVTYDGFKERMNQVLEEIKRD